MRVFIYNGGLRLVGKSGVGQAILHQREMRFTTIILLGKPLSIALYSLGLTVLFQQITGWLR